METTMFALGVLAMIMVMLVTVVVVGIVKVFRMHKQVREFYSHLTEIERYQGERLRDVERNNDNYHMMFQTQVNDQITDAVTQSSSYTDKRIDKLIDTYFAVKEAEETNKKLIKG